MSVDYEIRPAIPEDAADLGRVHQESSVAAYRHLIPADKVATMTIELFTERWHQRFANPKPVNHILLVRDEAAGFTTIGHCRDEGESHFGEVYSIYLAPKFWRQGWGEILMRSALEELRRAAYEIAKVWVLTDNPRARSFYERMGFMEDGTEKSIRMYGVELEEVRYSLNL